MLDWLNEVLLNWDMIVAFFISQLINVFLSTIKSVVLIRGTRLSATLINTISYTLNAAVVSVIGKVDDIIVVCIITAITNLTGVWISLWIMDKIRKESLWRISATVKTEYFDNLVEDLHNADIDFITYNTNWSKRTPIDVFSKTRKESEIVKNIFIKYKVKYTISINKGEL